VIEWIALGVSGVALFASLASLLHARRQTRAPEESNWLAHPLDFLVSITNPHSGAARLAVTYEAGLPLDEVAFELPDDEAVDRRIVGFGVGKAESPSWVVGSMRVGDTEERPVVQALSDGGAGPPYRSGPFRLRAVCRKGRQSRVVSMTGKIPSEPWLY
jgi:hypothetical protein